MRVVPASLACLSAALALPGCGGSDTGRKQSAEEVAQEISAVKLEPGQWQATNEILSAEATGIPPEELRQMVGQKTSVSNCVTPEQAARPSANFLAAQKDSNCTYRDFSMKSGRMTGTMSCAAPGMPGSMVMTMEGSYRPTSYEMKMDMQSSGMPGGMNMKIRARTTGKRIGDCA